MEKEQLRNDSVYLIHNLLTPQECAEYIKFAEYRGFDEAPITTKAGFVMRKDIRNNSRVMVDDEKIADELWTRARPFVQEEWFQRVAKGLNERFRFYKYDPGQRFAPHFDGYFERRNWDRSELTFMVYLNDDFSGGETVFYYGKEKLRVEPEAGTALVFVHKQLHEGAAVEAGTKYVMRTDVMYGGNSPE